MMVDLQKWEDTLKAKEGNTAKLITPVNKKEGLFEKEKGNAYFKKDKFKKAISCYTKSIDYDHTSDIPLVNRAMAYIKIEQYL